MRRFTEVMVPEIVQPFWEAMQSGELSPTRRSRPGRIERRELAGSRLPYG